jgi:mannitol 2-dehydrogenase
MKAVMDAQDCLYTMVVKDPDGRFEPRVIGSIVDYLFAPDDPEAVIERMADPATRIVSLTVTEGGYNIHAVTGQFDETNPDVGRRRRARGPAADHVRADHRGPVPPLAARACPPSW